MDKSTDIVVRISKNIDLLIATNKKLQEENAVLKSDIANLKTSVEKKEQELNNLKKQNEVLSVAKTLSGDGDANKEVKLKINELVREIDKCISLLNN
jgi:uncharacterized protein (DUF3084 family)